MIICICIKFWFFIQVYLDNKKKHSNVFFDNTFTITSIFHNYFKKNMKNKQGTYLIAGQEYQKNEGTRQEVWDGIAYQTSGVLHKHDLIMNKDGKLVSKKKCITASLQNHLEDYNASR